MKLTLKDLEDQLALEAQQRDLEEQARSAVWMVGLLVQRLGGEVTITDADMQTVAGYRLVRIEDPEGRTLTLRMELAHPVA